MYICMCVYYIRVHEIVFNCCVSVICRDRDDYTARRLLQPWCGASNFDRLGSLAATRIKTLNDIIYIYIPYTAYRPGLPRTRIYTYITYYSYYVYRYTWVHIIFICTYYILVYIIYIYIAYARVSRVSSSSWSSTVICIRDNPVSTLCACR